MPRTRRQLSALTPQLSRYRAGAVLLGFLCLISGAVGFRDALTNPPSSGAGIDITVLENRMQPLKATLGQDATVGFVTDVDPDPVTRVDASMVVMQYVMYPTIVESGAKANFVIGWFREGIPKYPGLIQVADYGNGIVLFRGVPY
jgi:hypothetical protein